MNEVITGKFVIYGEQKLRHEQLSSAKSTLVGAAVEDFSVLSGEFHSVMESVQSFLFVLVLPVEFNTLFP